MKKLLFPLMCAAAFSAGFFLFACQKENAEPQSVSTADEPVSDRIQQDACFCQFQVQTANGANGSGQGNVLTFNYVQPTTPQGGAPGVISVDLNGPVNQVIPIEILKGTAQSWNVSGTPKNTYKAGIKLSCSNSVRNWTVSAFANVPYNQSGSSSVNNNCTVN